MNPELRSQYVEYIAEAIRFAIKETGMDFPKETIIVAKSYSELANLNDILGLKIYVMDMPSSYDFFIAFPSENVKHYKLQKSFLDFLNLYDFDEVKT